MNREVLDKWCERGILGLVLLILCFMPVAFGGRPQLPGGFIFDFLLLDPFQVAEWVTIGVLLLWIVRLWFGAKPQLLWPPICWAVLAFTVYAIARYLTADIEFAARQELIRVLVYAFLFFAILNNLYRQESIQAITLALVFLAMAISGYAIYQFLTGSTQVWHVFTQYAHRASGTYICPNHLGGFLELLLPLGLAYTLAGRIKPLAKIFVGYATFMLLAGIAVSVSRGTWLATAIALVVFFSALILQRNYWIPALVALLLMITAGVLFMPKDYLFQARLKKLVVERKVDDDLRFFLWEPALKVWHENVWWGCGPAHFDYRFRQHRPESVQLQPDRVHNDFLNVLADWGIAGVVLISAAWALLALGVLKTWGSVKISADLGGKKNSNKFAFVLGSSVALLAIFLHSAVDFNMHIPANALLTVALMAMLTSHLRFATERYWLTARVLIRALVSVVLVAGMVYLGEQGIRRAGENYWLAKFGVHENEPYSPAQVAVLEKAFAFEPMNFDTAYKIGQAYRVQSLEGSDGPPSYKDLAARAMEWFQRGMKLNPWDGYNFLFYGWCLDWTGRQSESGPYFDRAEQLDPNGYFTMARIGLHFVEMNNFAAAKPWLERSLRLEGDNNPALGYLPLVYRQLVENATNDISAKLNFPSQQ